MTIQYMDKAEDACEQRAYAKAGQQYTFAAYEALLKCDYPEPEMISTGANLGRTFYYFENAAFTFRLAGNPARAANRVEQAILIVEDFDEYYFHPDVLHGLAQECLADLELIRGNEDVAMTHYDRAAELYEPVTDTAWMAETIFEYAFEFFRGVMHAAGSPVSVEEQLSMLDSFEKRVTAKRERLPRAIETVVTTGEYQPSKY
ncbi:hypothetical protein [Haloferax sp. DFSO60]|uniref:hypothetical protein n=1 Tax=Haloferax sp. DFSO60 TaxID=3388652 RepID=UPI00397DA2E7